MFDSIGNVSTITQRKCYNAELFADSLFYKLVMIAKIVLHIVGIFMMLYDCRSKLQKAMSIFHQNIIILCRSLQIIFTCMHVAFFIQNIIDIIRVFYPFSNPCDRLVVALVPSVLRLIGGSLVTSITFIYLLIATERITCTLLRSSYETTSQPKLTTFLVVLLVLLSFGINYYFKIYGSDMTAFFVSSVDSVVYDDDGYKIFNYFIAGLEIALILLFVFILQWNRKLQKRIQSAHLSLKYQVNQTIKVVKCFFPVVAAHFALNLWCLIAASIIPEVVHSTITTSELSELLINYSWNTHIYFIIKYLTLNKKKEFKTAKIRETNDDFYHRQKNMFNAKITR